MKKIFQTIILCGIIFCFWSKLAESTVILRTLVVNPSKTKTQAATLKAYLPEEVKPEHVIDLGDLKIDYDVNKGLYYVYKDVELAPGETLTRSIELQDVWVISEAEIEAINSRARELVKQLKKTESFNEGFNLQQEIEAQSNQILNNQAKAKEALPQRHIAVYRENTQTLTNVKSFLDRLEKLALQTKPGITTPVGRVSVKATWWVILGVIVALGLLSLIFFIIWQRQATIEEAKERLEEEEAEELSFTSEEKKEEET